MKPANPLLDGGGSGGERSTPLDDDGAGNGNKDTVRSEEKPPDARDTRSTPLDAPDEDKPKATPKPAEDGSKALREELDGVKSYLGNLHTFLVNKFTEQGKTPTEARAAATAAIEEGKETGELTQENFEQDPKGSLDKFFDAKMGPLLEEYRRDKVLDNYNRTKEHYKDKWPKYEAKVAEMMRTVPAEQLAQPGAFDILFKLARAEDIDNIEKEAFERGRKSVAESDDRVTGMHVRPGTTDDSPPTRLSAVERRIAAKFGMDDKTYDNWRAR